jgi:hypothetical protein
MKNYLDVWSHIRCKGKLIFQAVFDSQHAGLRTLVAWYYSFKEYFHSVTILEYLTPLPKSRTMEG